MAGRQSGRLWLCALLVVWASAAGAVSDAAAYAGSSTAPQISGAAAPPGPGEGGAAGRSIVVLSDNVSITLARGTFEGALEPFGPGEACFRVDRPLDLVGQLVDGNYTLLSHGGGREAARRNRGVAGHGETVRWWFNGAEQPPLPVAWRSPDVADDSVINGTFFVRDWVPAPELTQSAGVYKMRFSFAGTRLGFPGLGEFLVYPPCDLAPLNVTVVFPTEASAFPFDGPVDAVFQTIERITGIDVKLKDYQVRSVTVGEDAQGEQRREASGEERRRRAERESQHPPARRRAERSGLAEERPVGADQDRAAALRLQPRAQIATGPRRRAGAATAHGRAPSFSSSRYTTSPGRT